MSKCAKLLLKARNSASNLSFAEVCRLAECYGWEFERQKGSHRLYVNKNLEPFEGRTMNFQPDKSNNAKAYQVKQLLDAIENL